MKVKIADKREIPKVSLKQVSTERVGSPYLTRTEQQHVREGELPTTKIRLFKASGTASTGAAFSLSADTGISFNAVLTQLKGVFIIAWPTFNIYVAASALIDANGNADYLWPTGSQISDADEKLTFTTTQHIIGEATLPTGLGLNQQRVSFRIHNNDSSPHTYYIHVRWYYVEQDRIG